MDLTKPSLSSKVSHANNGGGNESLMEELVQRRGSVNGERQGDTETRDLDVVDGTIAAEINNHHRGSADKHKFTTFGYQRRTKQKVVTDFTTLSKGSSSGAKPRAALKQVLFSQGVSEKTSEDRGQLDVLKQYLGAYSVPESLTWKWNEESHGTTLEKSWTDLVHSHSTIPKMQKHQQEALWEFVHTELSYINKLKIITDFVIAALHDRNQHGFLLGVTPELLFSNLPSILLAHQLFWQEVVFPMLQEVRQTGKPFDPLRVEAGCLQFHERFSVYHEYCWEEEDNLEFTRRQMEGNPHFVVFVQWIEAQPQCERMRLGDMQAKPHQRITKYPLLLKAVLKNTQEAHVQQRLRGMLSSVNSFLESINDYMQLKDEQLALSISAQRIEGYEVEGLNEEIDKHVREISKFDLTCPIRGVGPRVVRKLLLEENLKVRVRKDSKLEVVALLFSDVLLLTKVQKKGERLKVVRPPLALDRMDCIPLKDGYSFLLVEVGELQSAMNALILAASTSDSCSTWVSTIQQAKKTLTTLREQENNRQENLRVRQLETKPGTEPKTDEMLMEEQPLTHPAGKDEPADEAINNHIVNGSTETKQHQPSEEQFPVNYRSALRSSQRSISGLKSVHESEAGGQQTLTQYKQIDTRLGRENDGNNWQEEEHIFETRMANEQSMKQSQRVQYVPYQDHFTQSRATYPLRPNRTGPHNLLVGGLPDVDYPTNEENTLQPHFQPAVSREGLFKPQKQGLLTKRDSDLLSVIQDTRRNSSSGQSVDMDAASEAWSFSKILRSPELRRRRPGSINQGPPNRQSQQLSRDSRQTLAASNSSSNSETDFNPNLKRNSLPAGFGREASPKVLKVASLKPNQGMFGNMQPRGAPDLQTFSESELSDQNFQNKKPKLKTQRSSSIPNIIIDGGHGRHGYPSKLYTSTQAEDTSSSGYNPDEHPSPLEGLLKKAKVRERDMVGMRRDKNIMVANLRSRYPTSPSYTPTPSPPPSDGERDTDWEEVAVMRPKALSVSTRWKEQLVDGDEDDKTSSFLLADGVNVDWLGWCFDDDEVMDRINPRDEGLLSDISRSLADCRLREFSEQEDGECSQV